MKSQVKVFFGPTASGKSAAALEYAAQHRSVIINADAMQCYDALHTLTAQPNSEEQAQVPHKLYGVINAAENIIVTDWRKMALAEIYKALESNDTPLLVGGTGFYIKALKEGLSPIPDIPKDVRNKAVSLYQSDGLAPLLLDLKKADKTALGLIDTDNPRRVIRAWEVYHATGRTIQDWQTEPLVGAPDDLEFKITLITRPRDDLIGRINTRFDKMLQQNILQEVQHLSDRIDKGEVGEENLITKAHGFRPLRSYLKGTKSLQDATEQSKAETRQYAKRQMTWARHQFNLDD